MELKIKEYDVRKQLEYDEKFRILIESEDVLDKNDVMKSFSEYIVKNSRVPLTGLNHGFVNDKHVYFIDCEIKKPDEELTCDNCGVVALSVTWDGVGEPVTYKSYTDGEDKIRFFCSKKCMQEWEIK